jgi:hypothetical protein
LAYTSVASTKVLFFCRRAPYLKELKNAII